MRRLHVCLCFEGYRKKYTSFEAAFFFDYDNYNFLFSGFSKMSSLRQLLKPVNLFSFKRRNQKNGILTLFLLWILFVFLLNVSIHSQSSETKTIFRSKNLLTDSKNLSETYSTTDNQYLRQRFVRSACQTQTFDSVQSKVTLLTDPEKSLGYCHVPKIATSSW